MTPLETYHHHLSQPYGGRYRREVRKLQFALLRSGTCADFDEAFACAVEEAEWLIDIIAAQVAA